MPLTPAYTWSETENSIRLTINNVPIKDQSQIFCSDRVVKLNAPPYLLLLDLKDTIDDDHSTATVIKGRDIQLSLAKSRPGQWGSLTATGEKNVIKQQREESIKRAHEKQVAAQQQRLARRQREEKAAIDHQISVEKAQRARLDTLKQQELQQEREQLQDWQQQLPSSNQHHAGSGDELDYEDDLAAGATEVPSAAEHRGVVTDHPDYYGRGWQRSKGQASADVDGNHGGVDPRDSHHKKHNAADSIISLSAGSKAQQTVRQFLAADAAAAASADTDAALNSSSTLDSNNHKQLMTIVSSNSISKEQQPQQPPLAAAKHYPPAPAFARPVAPVRCRGTPVAVTFTQLQTQHLPAREQREVEIKSIKRQAKGDSVDLSDRQPAFLKDKGDGLFVQGNYRGAINAYTHAIDLDPNQPSLWSNRAACHLALGAAEDCEADCTTAIQLLSAMYGKLMAAAGSPEEGQEMLAGLLPPTAAAVDAREIAVSMQSTAETEVLEEGPEELIEAVPQQLLDTQQQEAAQLPPSAAAAAAAEIAQHDGSLVLVKLQQQLVRVLSRRAAARVELQQLQDAANDLQQALRLDPDNVQLAADVLEVAAALDPTAAADPGSWKQRGDARFKAGDMQGAIEAYTTLIQHLEQQQPQLAAQQQELEDSSSKQQQEEQQQLMLAALSNRAASWLSLEKYEACVADCLAALHLAVGKVADPPAVNSSTGDETVDGAKVNSSNETAADDSQVAEQAMTILPPAIRHHLAQPQQLLATQGVVPARSVARLLGRAAVACCCLKQLQPAEQLYGLAESYWQVLGDTQRAAALAADRQKLQRLSAEPVGLDKVLPSN